MAGRLLFLSSNPHTAEKRRSFNRLRPEALHALDACVRSPCLSVGFFCFVFLLEVEAKKKQKNHAHKTNHNWNSSLKPLAECRLTIPGPNPSTTQHHNVTSWRVKQYGNIWHINTIPQTFTYTNAHTYRHAQHTRTYKIVKTDAQNPQEVTRSGHVQGHAM